MTHIKFVKPEPRDVQGNCARCQVRRQRYVKKGYYGTLCKRCQKDTGHSENPNAVYGRWQRTTPKAPRYTEFKKSSCELCGFVPVHLCQLDVDHIDGNHQNNDPENLQTLCANCHRLKTQQAKEGMWQFHRAGNGPRNTNRILPPMPLSDYLAQMN